MHYIIISTKSKTNPKTKEPPKGQILKEVLLIKKKFQTELKRAGCPAACLLCLSTMSAAGALNFCVRDGDRCVRPAIAAGPPCATRGPLKTGRLSRRDSVFQTLHASFFLVIKPSAY